MYARLFMCTISVLLLSCGSTPTKTSDNTQANANFSNGNVSGNGLSASEAFAQGSALYNQWYESEDSNLKLIKQAEALLKHALDLQPANAYYQLMHYNAYAAAHSTTLTFDEETMLTLYNTLPAAARSDVITPAFLAYSISDSANESIDIQINHLLRALEQNPINPQNWYLLSQLYTNSNQNWLAISTAQIAQQKMPDNAYYAFQLGLALSYAAQSDHCPSNEYALLKASAMQFTRASRIETENAYFHALASEAYLRLGLNPIALAQAKKAHTLAQDSITRSILFNAYFFSKQFDEAWQVHDDMIDAKDTDVEFYTQLRTWYDLEQASLNQKSLMPLIEKLIDNTKAQQDFNTFLVTAVLNATYVGMPFSEQFFENFQLDKSAEPIVTYLSSDYVRTPLQKQRFVESASNRCEANRYEFYVKLKDWLEGEYLVDEAFGREPGEANRLLYEDFWHLLIDEIAKIE